MSIQQKTNKAQPADYASQFCYAVTPAQLNRFAEVFANRPMGHNPVSLSILMYSVNKELGARTEWSA